MDVGCKACHLAGSGTAYAEGTANARYKWRGGLLRADKLQKHALSHSHMAAVASLTKCDACVEAVNKITDRRRAPSREEFEQVLGKRLCDTPIKRFNSYQDYPIPSG